MELWADRIVVAGTHQPLVPATTIVAPPRHVTLVAGDPGPGQVALALALGGRLPLAEGEVRLDGDPSPQLRRRHVQLVDVDGVTSPEESIALDYVVSEQLAFAGRPSGRAATHEFLAERGLTDRQRDRFELVDGPTRTTLLADVAAMRTATRVLVLANPDRLGGDPGPWWRHAHDLAEEGLTVVVLVAASTARLLEITPDHTIGGAR